MGGGMITLFGLALFAPLQYWQESSQKWRMLDPIEQNLRRASQGFALIVFTIGTPIYLYGAREVGMVFVKVAGDPLSNWPLAAGFALPLSVGLTRFWFGSQRLVRAGTRDGLRLVNGCARSAIGLGLAGSIRFSAWPWQLVGDSMLWTFVLMLALLAGIWMAITGAVRVVVLSWPQGASARAVVEAGIEADEFHWPRRAPRRRWWQPWRT